MANFLDSAALESIGNASKAPWLVEDEQIEGLEHHWQNANKVNTPYLPYKATPNGKMPSRQAPPGVPVATVALNGARNAGILAAQIIGAHDKGIETRLADMKEKMRQKVEAIADDVESKGFRNI